MEGLSGGTQTSGGSLTSCGQADGVREITSYIINCNYEMIDNHSLKFAYLSLYADNTLHNVTTQAVLLLIVHDL